MNLISELANKTLPPHVANPTAPEGGGVSRSRHRVSKLQIGPLRFLNLLFIALAAVIDACGHRTLGASLSLRPGPCSCGRVASKPHRFPYLTWICDSLGRSKLLCVLTSNRTTMEDGMQILSFSSLTAGTLLAASLTAVTASAADLPRRAPRASASGGLHTGRFLDRLLHRRQSRRCVG